MKQITCRGERIFVTLHPKLSKLMKFSDEQPTPNITVGHVQVKDYVSDTIVNEDALPVLPTRNLVLFPEVSIPIKLVRPASLQTAREAWKKGVAICIVCQKNTEADDPTTGDLYRYGVLADVLQVIDLPDDSHMAIVRSRHKVKILGAAGASLCPIECSLAVKAKIIKDIVPPNSDKEFIAVVKDIKNTAEKIVSAVSEGPSELGMTLATIEADKKPNEIISAVATHIPCDIDCKISLLSLYHVRARAEHLLTELARQEEMMSLAETVHRRARESFDEQQRRAFLQRQMEAIDQELNGNDGDIESLKARADKSNMPLKVRETFDKELSRLGRLNPQSPDYSVQYSYLETLLELPWEQRSTLNDDFSKGAQILDLNHYGLDKVKERILEQIAVMINSPSSHAPILCLVGPPGVGKTSLGQSIASALNRKYQRISLGGMHDEAEIRGHRRTYIGSMPGRIMTAIQRAGTVNPVLLLDEIDKLGKDFKGDPSSALLEVLDPEQNFRFHDNYIDVDFDLSEVLFIATANNISELPRPLLDRMEVIRLSSYLPEEKAAIAQRHLVPKIREKLNLEDAEFELTGDAISDIIDSYTSESGVRQFEQKLTALGRKIIVNKLKGTDIPMPLSPEAIRELLGTPIYKRDRYEGNDFAGVATGLAWTEVGGDILYIETALTPGKEGKLTLTGNLGDVMKESAMIALQYVRSHAPENGIDPALFERYNIHIHVPEGAIPKDGPSAGITIATSIMSALKQCKVMARVAMTGEITLRGRVLPVGGIKEKILAAKRAGVTDIILSEENKRDVEDIQDIYRNGLVFHYVNKVSEVFDIALTDETAADAIKRV